MASLSVRHSMDFHNEPSVFAALCLLSDSGNPADNTVRVLEGPVPDWKYFGLPDSGNGLGGRTYGLPRFRECAFLARFPFATVFLRDPAVPLSVELTAWSPFTPPDADSSSLPAGALEYRFKNTSQKNLRAVFSFNCRGNFMARAKGASNGALADSAGSIGPIAGGFVLHEQQAAATRAGGPSFAFFVNDPAVVVDHCWFRGRWFDAMTVAWDNVAGGRPVANPPVPGNAPGASLALPFTLKPGEERVVRLNTVWFVPSGNLSSGVSKTAAPVPTPGAAFGAGPVRPENYPNPRVRSAFNQRGQRFLSSYNTPHLDDATGVLASAPFTLQRPRLNLLVSGGAFPGATCVNLLVAGKIVRTATGDGDETLRWKSWDVSPFAGQAAVIEIVDRRTGPWGHINVDDIVQSDVPATTSVPPGSLAVCDFEFASWKNSGWTARDEAAPGKASYAPWYASKFNSIHAAAAHWRDNAPALRERSAKFRDALFASTIPPEALEAVAANLSILKSPTVLRQTDGRLWCWEGNFDNRGACAGSCTHVWNYEQALCRLFPSLARDARRSVFFEGQDAKGRQAFRLNLPLSPGGTAFDAADGQLGEIMKVHREWKFSADDAFLRALWPKVKTAINYAIAKWDPRETGLLEESHHNTYDINYYGPDGHCGTFYLGALAAVSKMGAAMGEDVSRYQTLLAKGRARLETELFNGEYFVQRVAKSGLVENFKPLNPDDQSAAYRDTARRINDEGPKYQYGAGCLSDGVLGLWLARLCGITDDLVDPKLVRSHLLAVHRHNLKNNLSTHANPQRPNYAMGDDAGLLLCTWPRGGKPLLPFVYSDEVWTGIEYQVASHLALSGEPAKALEIVRAVRNRYDGVRRNPFNEYEWGHWYGRALSSYALLPAFSGVSYDPAAQKILVAPNAPRDGAFLLNAPAGTGLVTLKNGRPSLAVIEGQIPLKN
ncbi:MAG: hypothetical protein LBR12_01565 [Opitutaceae bacterium]|nr:hypothetical protein [Opitutaceae bacterium]